MLAYQDFFTCVNEILSDAPEHSSTSEKCDLAEAWMPVNADEQ